MGRLLCIGFLFYYVSNENYLGAVVFGAVTLLLNSFGHGKG